MIFWSKLGMKKISKVAEECDVTLGMEILNRFEGYLLNTCDEGINYINAVGSKKVKIMLDTFHMNIEEDNIAAAPQRRLRWLSATAAPPQATPAPAYTGGTVCSFPPALCVSAKSAPPDG